MWFDCGDLTQWLLMHQLAATMDSAACHLPHRADHLLLQLVQRYKVVKVAYTRSSSYHMG